jgi:hypothetical protein
MENAQLVILELLIKINMFSKILKLLIFILKKKGKEALNETILLGVSKLTKETDTGFIRNNN